MYVVVRWYKCGCTTSIRITILWKLVRKVSFRHLLCLGKKEKKIEDNFFIEMGGKYLIEKIDGFTYASIRFRGYWFPYFKCILDIYRKSNFLKRVEDEIWFIGFYPIPKSMLKFRRRVKKGGFFLSYRDRLTSLNHGNFEDYLDFVWLRCFCPFDTTYLQPTIFLHFCHILANGN